MSWYLSSEIFGMLVGLSWFSAFYYRKQLMIVLLSLEFMVLGLFLSFVSVMGSLDKSVSFTFYLLILGACEASVGLCLLVVLTRYMGSDTLSVRSMC